jgi:hypothetical protein
MTNTVYSFQDSHPIYTLAGYAFLPFKHAMKEPMRSCLAV